MAIMTKRISSIDFSTEPQNKKSSKTKNKDNASDSFSDIINLSSNNYKDNSEMNINNSKSDGVSDYKKDLSRTSDDLKKIDSYSKEKVDNKDLNNNNKINDSENADIKDIKNQEDSLDTKNDLINSYIDTDTDTNINSFIKDINDFVPELDENNEQIDDLVSEIAALINNIIDVLKDKLNIEEDGIQDALSALDFEFSDLLDLKKIDQFVLQTQDATEVDILIDEQLSGLIEDIKTEVGDLINELDSLSFDDEFITFNNESNEVVEVPTKEILNQVDMILNPDVEDKDTDNVSLETNKVNDFVFDKEIEVVADTKNGTSNDSSSEGFDSNNQSVIQNLNNTLKEVVANEINENQDLFNEVQDTDIVRQVVDEIRTHITNETTTLEMRLNPESLGRVQITVSSRNGVMQAQIVAETEAAKNAIEANLSMLRETFNNQDLKVEAVEVTIASYGFFENEHQETNGENENGSSNGRKIRIKSNGDIQEETSEDDQIETQIMRAKGNSVSYSI